MCALMIKEKLRCNSVSNPFLDSKFMKGYRYYKAEDHSTKYNAYIFDMNDEIEIIGGKADAGFIIDVDDNKIIKDIGWFKP